MSFQAVGWRERMSRSSQTSFPTFLFFLRVATVAVACRSPTWCRERGDRRGSPANDRGLLESARADINVIDFSQRWALMIHDLPAGGNLMRRRGYQATLARITYRDGVATGALPGGLVPGMRAAPIRVRLNPLTVASAGFMLRCISVNFASAGCRAPVVASAGPPTG